MSNAFFPTRLRSPVPADLPALLATGVLGGIVLAASLMAIAFCFIAD